MSVTETAAETAEPEKDYDSEELIARFNKWDASLDAHWSDWREEARTCFGMTAGHQIGKEERERAEDAGVAYVVINVIDPTISAICGSEILGRQEVKFFPREQSQRAPVMGEDGQPVIDPKTGQPQLGDLQDAKVNEILTGAADWVRDEGDTPEEESQSFRDCLTCGIGWTETRMDYEEDPDGMPKTERIDALEISGDPTARRPNVVDARYLRRKRRFPKEEAKDRFGIDSADYESAQTPTSAQSFPHENYPHSAYDKGKTTDEAPLGKDEIEITEYQWYDLVPAYAVLNPQTQQMETLSDKEYAAVKMLPGLKVQKIKQRRYRRCFRVANQILECNDMPDGEFTYKAITGKLDRNKGVWYGVVRAMIDPQRLNNKMVSQTQRIVDHNAKGGLLAEVDAFEDQQQAEGDWARSDSIVWAKSGSLSGGHPKIMPKPVGSYPAAIDKLLQIATDSVYAVTGVNKEMLGIAGIDQVETPGILDMQRKQAAYTVLASFFDSLRRYRKQQGRHLLKLITKYMSDGRLIRIVGRQGNVQYIPLVKQSDTAKYDVIVDEAPAGPNQKEKTFAFLQSPFGAQLMAEAPPAIQLKLLEYTPLPSSLVSEIQEIANNLPPQVDPAQQKIDGELKIRQAQMQADQQNQAAQLEMKQKEAAGNLMIQHEAGQASLQQKREEAALNMQLLREKAAGEYQIGQDRIEQEKQLSLLRIQAEAVVARERMAIEAEIERENIAAQERIGIHKNKIAGDVQMHKDREGGAVGV